MIITVFEKVENIVGKGENAVLISISSSIFKGCFSKVRIFRGREELGLYGKELSLYQPTKF